MINSVTLYECDYCKKTYPTQQEARDCFERHPIVFVIEKYNYSIDCWGNTDGYWSVTDYVFRDYNNAKEFVEKSVDDLCITYRKLCD